MTKAQTYQTRVLTARDHQLIDQLQANPRFRALGERLRPPIAKPKATKVKPVAEAVLYDEDDREPPLEVAKPVAQAAKPEPQK